MFTLRWMDVRPDSAPGRIYPLAREYRRALIAASYAARVPEDLWARLHDQPVPVLAAHVHVVAPAAVRAVDAESPAEALATARRQRYARQRAVALAGAAARLADAGDRAATDVAVEAYVAAAGIRDVTDRVRVVGSVVPYLPARLLPGVLVDARRVLSPHRRIPLLLALGARLDGAVAEALSLARTAATAPERITLGVLVVPHLAGSDRREEVAGVLAAFEDDVGDRVEDFGRAQALVALAPYLGDLVEQAWMFARHLIREGARRDAMVALLPHLPPTSIPTVLADLRRFADVSVRAQVLSALVAYLPPDLRPDAIAAARWFGDEAARAGALAALAHRLPATTRADTVRAALPPIDPATGSPELGWVHGGLAELLPAAAVPAFVAAARALSDPDSRAWTLARLAPALPADTRGPIAVEALAAGGGLEEPGDLVGFLAPFLPTDRFGEALDLARYGGDGVFVEALRGVVAHLPHRWLAQVLTDVSDFENGWTRARALEILTPHVPVRLVPTALGLARGIAEPDWRAAAVAAVAARLPTTRRAAEVTAEVAGLGRVADPVAARAVRIALVAHLDGVARADVVEALLADARAERDPRRRTELMTAILPVLAAAQRPVIAAEAWTAARSMPDSGHRLRKLTALAPHQPPARLPELLDLLAGLPDPVERAIDLTELAPLLPAELLPRAVALAAETGAYTAATLGALLTRGHTLWREDRTVPLVELARLAIRGRTRAQCLALGAALAPILADVDGAAAVAAAVDAIALIGRRWP